MRASVSACKSDFLNQPMREKCPNAELFLVRIFLYSVRIQENMDQRKLRIWKLFTQCQIYSDNQEQG